jgi:hypothetical protein
MAQKGAAYSDKTSSMKVKVTLTALLRSQLSGLYSQAQLQVQTQFHVTISPTRCSQSEDSLRRCNTTQNSYPTGLKPKISKAQT